MQLENARAVLRARSPHESADLGLRLLRGLGRPTLYAWLGFVLPLQLAAVLAVPGVAEPAAYLAVWWLKPAYERAYGLVVGRGLFGEAPAGKALYGALWRDGRRGLLGDLLWRRLDPARALVLAVPLLEGLRGAAARRRRRALGEDSTPHLLVLGLACVGLELSVLSGLMVGGAMMLPDELGFFAEGSTALDFARLVARLKLTAYVLAVGAVEPLFVAAGFGLYVNRRTCLEGWDIELAFRRMAQRLAAAGVLGCALALGLCAPAAAGAALRRGCSPPRQAGCRPPLRPAALGPRPALADPGPAAEAMARVLARPELARVHQEEHWELRRSSEQEAPPEVGGLLAMRFAELLAKVAELGVWLVAGAAVVVMLYLVLMRLDRRAPAKPTARTESAARVQPIAGHAPALPIAEVLPRARALLAEGRHAAALSVLYVGTLGALLDEDGLALPRQATEGQCLAAVEAAPIAEERRALFSELTALWQLAAYAHAALEPARLEALCARFGACFARAR